PPPPPTLFPYTTLFRSTRVERHEHALTNLLDLGVLQVGRQLLGLLLHLPADDRTCRAADRRADNRAARRRAGRIADHRANRTTTRRTDDRTPLRLRQVAATRHEGDHHSQRQHRSGARPKHHPHYSSIHLVWDQSWCPAREVANPVPVGFIRKSDAVTRLCLRAA